MNKKKKTIIITFALIAVISIVGVSYALWVINLSQTDKNVISSSCFNVAFSDKDDISIQKAYPLLDEDGKKLTPYEFTITNTCDSYASYNINLEILNTTTLTNNSAIKFMLATKKDSTENELKTALLSTLASTTKTLDKASSSLNIITGTLNAKESKTYTLRLWLDENVDASTSNVQNAKFSSKVVVTTTYLTPAVGKDVLTYVKENADSSSNDVYTVPGISSDSCTYTLAYDGTTDNNLRYVGANPCNYVTFNGEKAGWRIIGILKTPEGQRLKLIRANSIGEYSWGNKTTNGMNSWPDSILKDVLNSGAYYNRTSGTCPFDEIQQTVNCDFTNNGLTEEAKKQIDTITWQLGGVDNNGYITSSNGLASHFYTYERGTTVYSGGPTEWQGKVGLMYPSDYGYATSGGSTSNRTSCLNKELYHWNDSSFSDCKNNDWLYNPSHGQWSLTSNSSLDNSLCRITTQGSVYCRASSHNQSDTFPSIYLKSNVTILSGEGTLESPYEIG